MENRFLLYFFFSPNAIVQNEIDLDTITTSGVLSQDYFHRYGQEDEDNHCDSGEDVADDELDTRNVEHLTQNLSDLNVEGTKSKVCVFILLGNLRT